MELFTQLCSVVTTTATYKLILKKFIFMIMNIPLYYEIFHNTAASDS